jgi:hypothetical protein
MNGALKVVCFVKNGEYKSQSTLANVVSPQPTYDQMAALFVPMP